MIDSKLAIPASAEVVQMTKDALQEMEREFIMLRFKFASPSGKHGNLIMDVKYIGHLTVHPARDQMFMNNIRHEMKRLEDLLSRDESYITLKRVKAMRQRFIGMKLNSQNAGNTRSTSAWNIKSAKFLAGKMLAGIFCEHLHRDLFIL